MTTFYLANKTVAKLLWAKACKTPISPEKLLGTNPRLSITDIEGRNTLNLMIEYPRATVMANPNRIVPMYVRQGDTCYLANIHVPPLLEEIEGAPTTVRMLTRFGHEPPLVIRAKRLVTV